VTDADPHSTLCIAIGRAILLPDKYVAAFHSANILAPGSVPKPLENFIPTPPTK
jgi:hypothetical protein